MTQAQRLLTLLACAFTLATAVHAQRTWPTQGRNPYDYAVDVVTVSQPGVRHKCHVREATASSLICGRSFGRVGTVYQRDDIAAIIEPPSHFTVRNTVLVSLAAAGLIAGSFFVPVAPLVIAMDSVGGITLLVTPLSLGFGNDDHNDDVLTYQRPETPLTVVLRGHR